MREHAGRRAAAAIGRVVAFLALFLALVGLLVFVGNLALGESFVASMAVQTGAMAVAATVAGILLLAKLDHRPAGALGIAWTRRTPAEWGLGLALGLGAIAVAAALLLASGRLQYAAEAGTAASWAAAVAAHFAVFAVAAYAEEALFRGYAYQVLVRGIGPVAATVLASGGFALAHAQNPNVDALALVNIFAAGVLLSVAYLRTLSLWFATAVHLGWNWGMASLFDLPVSGITAFETPLYEPVIGGPAWLSGGAFGPEAGLIGTVAFAGALLVMLRMGRVAPAPQMLALRPIVEDREGMA